jgi:hypothetical protein
MRTLGIARIALRKERAQSSPIRRVETGGGSIRQSSGNAVGGNRFTKPPLNSARINLY